MNFSSKDIIKKKRLAIVGFALIRTILVMIVDTMFVCMVALLEIVVGIVGVLTKSHTF